MNYALWHKLPSAAFVIFGALVYAALMQLLWQRVLPRFSRLTLGRRIAAQTAVSLLAFGALSVGLMELRAILLSESSLLFPYQGPDVTITIAAQTIRRAPLIFSLIPILPVVLICVVGFHQHWWRIVRLQSRQEALRELAVSAQLAALRAQVNPHFLFNSLNSIAQLIVTEPRKAEACVERLAEIYRYLLHRAHTDFVPLAEELSVAESYLEIERARFGDALHVEEHIDARARDLLLPSLILQPLVENAVKHGISPKVGGGRVTIEARIAGGDLRLAVRDTGVGFGLGDQRAMFEHGVGLRNVRERLLRLYGADYAPQVVSQPGAGTTVTLRIPVVQGSA
ncbi:MAG TPA: histidine kinase, partial [Candidatus Dormibacteraeota bacterium]|nr:histidine kinase [Candidatus Dormibacteraeota bacterium]